MKENTRNMLVGLFVLASLSVLGLLMVWFGETPSWLPSNEWVLRITDVQSLSGVGEGSAVNLNGVEIGRVSELAFEDPKRPDRGVVIIARIQRDFSVPEGAYAKVYGSTFGIGAGHIDIVVEPGASHKPLPKELASIRGEMRSVIGEMISKDLVQSVERMIVHIGDLAAAAEPVAKNLAELLEQRTVAETTAPEGPTPNLSTVVERLDRLVANFNAVLGDENVQGDVKAAVSDIRVATRDLRELIVFVQRESERVSENLNTGLTETEKNLQESFVKLHSVLEQLDDAASSLAVVMRQVSEGQGTAGLLVRDERLYEAAVLSLERFSVLVGTLQRIAGQVERDGYINVGKNTGLGVWTKKIPVGPGLDGPDDTSP